MKKILFAMLLLLAGAANAKSTDWSKVGLYYTNKCNQYTFELSGIDTNCMSYRYVEITSASSQVLLRQQNGSRIYNLTFPAKGKYYATVLIMNKCNGDDTLWVDTINVTCQPCKMTGAGFSYTNKCNVYTFEANTMGAAPCWKYQFKIVNSTGTATYLPQSRVATYEFKAKGYYNVCAKFYDSCNKCDTWTCKTVFVDCLPVTKKCDWSKAGVYYTNNCGKVSFELGSYIDSCVQYTAHRYSHKTGKWELMNMNRVFTSTMDTGLYTFKVRFYNRCNGCDTFIYRERVYIGCKTAKKCDWSKAGFSYINKCGTVLFEMGSFIDTCTKYRTVRYNHKTGKLDTIGDSRIFAKTMDTGLYSFKTFFVNKCTGCDTFIYKPNVYIGCDPTVGVNSIGKVEFQVVPNPGYDYIEIRYEGQELPLYIHDPAGRVVYKGSTSDITIDVQNFSEGIYTILIGRTQKKIYIRR